jgi:phosphopantetheine adenylyltransferase
MVNWKTQKNNIIPFERRSKNKLNEISKKQISNKIDIINIEKPAKKICTCSHFFDFVRVDSINR